MHELHVMQPYASAFGTHCLHLLADRPGVTADSSESSELPRHCPKCASKASTNSFFEALMAQTELSVTQCHVLSRAALGCVLMPYNKTAPWSPWDASISFWRGTLGTGPTRHSNSL
jgi:hypothetical protein